MPTAATASTAGQRNDEARQRLLAAADELMYEKGYEAVGVAELCQAADVRKGSFYHFFDSKQSLALAMLDTAWDRARRHLFEPFQDDTISAPDALDRYGDLLAGQLRRTFDLEDGFVAGCRFGNFASELATRDETIRNRLTEVFDEMEHAVATAIERDLARGQLPPGTDPVRAAADIVAFMEGRMVMAKVRRDPELLADLGTASRRFLG